MTGKAQRLHLHPSILRANHQIYAEAAPVLYSSNIFRIELLTRPTRSCRMGRLPPPVLNFATFFRSDETSHDASLQPGEYSTILQTSYVGLIHPHCFRRLRHLELVVTHTAIWGFIERRDFFSPTGKLVFELLRILADDDEDSVQMGKSLKAISQTSLVGRQKPFACNKRADP